MEIKPGQIYKHFKGDTYRIIAVAKDHATLEWVVVYERLTDIAHSDWRVWSRAVKEFNEEIDKPEYKGPRFVLVSE
jgi:hypothetical protein